MVRVIQTHRHHQMTSLDVGILAERLLNPELLQFHLATFLSLRLPFAAFFIFLLISPASAAMLKLNFRAQRPALAKVISQIHHSMRNVKPSMTRVILVLVSQAVTAHVVAIEIA